MLQNPSVRNWLGGIEPAWTLLDQDSFEALRRPPSSRASVITLARDFSPDEIGQSAVARNTLILLHAASAGSGLKLTTTGNLTRGVVAEMIDLFTWPGFDKADAFRFHKVINEPDFLPLYFVRHVAESIRLVRQHKGRLKITSVGCQVLEDPARQSLQALLFHTAMWGIDLNYLGQSLHEGWPQRDIGVLLWSLSVSANDWQSSDRLTRMCTIPINGVLEAQWDSGAMAMQARVLRPLWWFGLLEYRRVEVPGKRFEASHFYRKTPLFDRFLTFDVKLETAAGSRH
ncbi:MAG: hypothetical protein NTV97_31550 [Alphaproteobacteria bacterium]|nr:hypothetical protein [Alphaproteobacteria bacterium]